MGLVFGLFSGAIQGSVDLGLKVGSFIWGLTTISALVVGIKNFITPNKNNQNQMATQSPTEQQMLSRV